MSTKSCHQADTPVSFASAAPKFACPICEARSLLADAISAEVKAAAQVYHLANHWRSAHESRELSNFQAEDLSKDSLAQFAADTAKEADWFSQYQAAIVEHARLSAESAVCRETYHQRLKAYTDTRKAKGCGCS
jgi:hypothetical protein